MTTRALTRRRTRQIMALFYRMAVQFWATERLNARLGGGSEAKAARRLAMWGRLGALYRERAEVMGGLLIKAGQILSARSDLFPPEFTRPLAALQDTVPGVPFAAIREVVEAEFGEPLGRVFASFEPEPLAAASLGQVHRAVLPDGTAVVVKVLRPGVEDLIRADLEGFRLIVRFLLRWTRWARSFDLAGLYYESLRVLLRELDLRDEARHTERFARMFEGDPRVAIPAVYPAFTRQRVLTLGYMPGLKITDGPGLEAAGIDPSAVAALMVNALSRQVLGEGFFHADPHPGNVLVQPGPRLVLLDFGMVGQLTPRHRAAFKRLGLAFLSRDPDALIAGLDELEMLREGADRAALSRALAWIFEQQAQTDLFALKPEDFLAIAGDVRKLLYSQAFRFPSDIAFLGRGASTAIGVARGLDPSGNFIKHIESAVREHLQARRETAETLREAAENLARLPARFERILTGLERLGTPAGAMPLGMLPGAAGGGPKPARGLWPAAGFSAGLVGLAVLTAAEKPEALWYGLLAGLCALWGLWRRLPPPPLEP